MGDIGIYDVLLVLTLLSVAVKALFGHDSFTATVFFIAYGLLISLTWIQLGATDVALAEAGVGAGLTGALFLGAVQRFEKDTSTLDSHALLHNLGLGISACMLSMATFLSVWLLRVAPGGVFTSVRENMPISGSTHPVTSVLLNFRAFDTWLELGVLVLAAYSALILSKVNDEHLPPRSTEFIYAQARIIARIMLPLLILTGGVMLWFGARDPGGAFQAGALVGAAGILLQLAGIYPSREILALAFTRAFRTILLAGFGAFLLVAIGTTSVGGNLLQYPTTWASSLILLIEIAATASIALTLNVMYACCSPREEIRQ